MLKSMLEKMARFSDFYCESDGPSGQVIYYYLRLFTTIYYVF